jgi:hypothetical protein
VYERLTPETRKNCYNMFEAAADFIENSVSGTLFSEYCLPNHAEWSRAKRQRSRTHVQCPAHTQPSRTGFLVWRPTGKSRRSGWMTRREALIFPNPFVILHFDSATLALWAAVRCLPWRLPNME